MRTSPYLQMIKPDTYQSIWHRYCLGGCGILAFSMQKRIGWNVVLLGRYNDHAAVISPCEKYVLDFNGIIGLAETLAGYDIAIGERTYRMRQQDVHKILNLKDKDDREHFFDATWSYKIPPRDMITANELDKCPMHRFWVNRTIHRAKVAHPNLFT